MICGMTIQITNAPYDPRRYSMLTRIRQDMYTAPDSMITAPARPSVTPSPLPAVFVRRRILRAIHHMRPAINTDRLFNICTSFKICLRRYFTSCIAVSEKCKPHQNQYPSRLIVVCETERTGDYVRLVSRGNSEILRSYQHLPQVLQKLEHKWPYFRSIQGTFGRSDTISDSFGRQGLPWNTHYEAIAQQRLKCQDDIA